MVLNDTVLYEQLMKLAESGAKPVHFKWTGEFLYNNAVLKAFKVIGFTIVGNYVNNLTNIIVVKVLVKNSEVTVLEQINKRGLHELF